MARSLKPTEKQLQQAKDYLELYNRERNASAARTQAFLQLTAGTLIGIIVGSYVGRRFFVAVFHEPHEMTALGAMLGAIIGFLAARILVRKTDKVAKANAVIKAAADSEKKEEKKEPG